MKQFKKAHLAITTGDTGVYIQVKGDRYALPTDFNSISKYFGEKNGVVIRSICRTTAKEKKPSFSSPLTRPNY